ncbi:glutathione S-transferase E14-like [Contarinia nasturtii]|uniref:glutathione S-transferase E8 n=1 Tax=Contarinia nasturtii TaxID=265458 RepID=UPI0012D4C2A2|nr:glutathione S-transferase E8 [Contarinia nasturtii]
MKPELYLDRRSPPVRSVLMLIQALGIEVEEKIIDLSKGEHFGESFLKINSCHTVPTFRDSKITLTDSHCILIYLCENYGKGNNLLWPSDPYQRIQVLSKLFYSGTLLFRRDSDAIGQIIINKLKKEQVEEHAVKFREQFDILENFLTENEFIACDTMTIADFSVVTIVSTMDMIVPVVVESWPKLHNWWFNHMKKLPFYEKVNQDGLNALKEWAKQSTDFKINM